MSSGGWTYTATKLVRRAGLVGGAVVGVPLTLSVAYSQYVYATTPQNQISLAHTPYSIWVQSVTNLFMSKLGQRSAERLDSACGGAARVNEDLLLSLLQKAKDTVYGRDHNLGGISSRDDFRRKHPITDHDHYSPYIDRICDGEENIMFAEPPRMIGETSGTSGTRKLVPVSMLQRKVFFSSGIAITFDALQRGVRDWSNGKIGWPNLQKSCKLMIAPNYSHTRSGVKIGPNSSAPGDNRTLLQLYTTPEEAYEVKNESELLFLHCLYALLDKNLGFIESNFASRVFNFFVCLDERWDDLVSTVRTGRFPKDLKINALVRENLERHLRPNPQRADELVRVRSEVNGEEESFVRRIWPSLHTILAVETGSFKIYGDKLRNEWIGNDVCIYSPLYAATEGLIGVNPDMNGKTYVLQPEAMFFEFLPESADMSSSKSNTLFIEQLEPGKTYEMIITNLTGLYRYRFGDVIRCVGYRGEAPVVEFAYRKGQFLNAQGERTSEEAFYSALSKAVSDDWKLQLGEYTTVEYFATGDRRPRYTVYVELMDASKENEHIARPLTDAELDALDARLSDANKFYALFRSKERLHRVEAIPVRAGTFERLRDAMISDLGISPSQIKQPRVTRNARLVSILEEGAVSG